MNEKYVIFGENSDYWKTVFSELYSVKDVFIFDGFENGLLEKAHRLHNMWPLNKYFELPLKSIWYNKYIPKGILNREDKIYFILFEGCHQAFSRKYLGYLKKNYPNSKFSFVFLNPPSAYNLDKLDRIKDLYDGVVGFSEEDAKKYNWFYYADIYSKIKVDETDLPESDIFFIGLNKGRHGKLINIYERLSKEGLKCDFHIIDVEKEQQKYQESIEYNKKMTYNEVLQHTLKTKCILEILQNDSNYCSARTYEAVAYRKKLLTTNQLITKKTFYNPAIIRSFKDAGDIDIDFLKNKVSDISVFPETDLFSPRHFLEFIKDKL